MAPSIYAPGVASAGTFRSRGDRTYGDLLAILFTTVSWRPTGAGLAALGAGIVRSELGDYHHAFVASGAICLVAALMALLVGRRVAPEPFHDINCCRHLGQSTARASTVQTMCAPTNPHRSPRTSLAKK